MPRFRFECSFYTWMYRVVTNVCLDHLRRRSSRPEDQAPEYAVNSQGDAPATDFFDRQQEQRASSDPERRMMGLEIGQRISTALKRLTPRERMVFEMKHYQGLKLRAIGEALGTSEETVKNSLFRATRKLRAATGRIAVSETFTNNAEIAADDPLRRHRIAGRPLCLRRTRCGRARGA